MSTTTKADNVRGILADIDHLINEMMEIRRRVSTLTDGKKNEQSLSSVKDAEWFGMWADREDLKNLSSREWLQQLRAQPDRKFFEVCRCICGN